MLKNVDGCGVDLKSNLRTANCIAFRNVVLVETHLCAYPITLTSAVLI